MARERRPDLGGKTRAGKEREAAKAREEAAVREVFLLLLVLLVLLVLGMFHTWYFCCFVLLLLGTFGPKVLVMAIKELGCKGTFGTFGDW